MLPQSLNCKTIALLSLLALSLTLGACASAARPDHMMISMANRQSLAPVDAGYKTLKVGTVSGGGSTNPLWISGVSASDFKQALEASLGETKLLGDIGAAGSIVSAQLESLDRPLIGIDLTVKSTVKYTVMPPSSANPTFVETITESGTAKFGESLLAVERLRLANEASIKKNIATFIDHYLASLR